MLIIGCVHINATSFHTWWTLAVTAEDASLGLVCRRMSRPQHERNMSLAHNRINYNFWINQILPLSLSKCDNESNTSEHKSKHEYALAHQWPRVRLFVQIRTHYYILQHYTSRPSRWIVCATVDIRAHDTHWHKSVDVSVHWHLLVQIKHQQTSVHICIHQQYIDTHNHTSAHSNEVSVTITSQCVHISTQ